ncbi:hypothetical protein BGAL_0173g00190 [Botrytis galanthina]|uniref:Killer toxin Kp4 domain-containing protein n=1 Tax=Botrytis galanthina TaxID=278940 RepID=A0A4S8QX30_9HELO|nr:hypothetical protein BGAL_0173g00190 [Botrytis galanthina]
MQFATLTIVVSALATTVFADNCITGFRYCGSDLISKGDYKYTIQQTLVANGINANDDHNINEGLFNCLADGWISYVQVCSPKCNWLGNGKQGDDYC